MADPRWLKEATRCNSGHLGLAEESVRLLAPFAQCQRMLELPAEIEFPSTLGEYLKRTAAPRPD
jgi:hypothetical protein